MDVLRDRSLFCYVQYVWGQWTKGWFNQFCSLNTTDDGALTHEELLEDRWLVKVITT